MTSKFPMYRNTSATSSPLPFSQSTSAKSNCASDGSSSSPSLFGSSLPSSSSRTYRPVIPGTPYRRLDPTCTTLPPRSPLLSLRDHSPSPATS
ncbi:tensin-1 [Trichonephila clavipes]|nr:tensin-1 [Trichonephila clavipes]